GISFPGQALEFDYGPEEAAVADYARLHKLALWQIKFVGRQFSEGRECEDPLFRHIGCDDQCKVGSVENAPWNAEPLARFPTENNFSTLIWAETDADHHLIRFLCPSAVKQ